MTDTEMFLSCWNEDAQQMSESAGFVFTPSVGPACGDRLADEPSIREANGHWIHMARGEDGRLWAYTHKCWFAVVPKEP